VHGNREKIALTRVAPPASYPISIHQQNALVDFGLAQTGGHFCHPRGYLLSAPVTVVEQNRTLGSTVMRANFIWKS
jgi:hypothetical protein